LCEEIEGLAGYGGVIIRQRVPEFGIPLVHRLEMLMTAAKFERSRDALVKDFAEVLTEADTLLKQATKETGERATDLRAQVEVKLRAAKLKLQDMQDDAMERAKATARATDEYVRDNPWQALGVAAAVGFLMGMLISRR
jgi:ElaB/YqjD/DUF883 family membrane-anchored ribosome-binding protein